MSNFFVADDKIPITQQSVAIPAQNGLNYNATQTIEIQVPPTTKFINPKESYLQFFVNITPDATVGLGSSRFQLDTEIGANILIKDIRIYDGNRNTLLEEITDYNTMVSMKYDYETNESLRNKRALAEGASTAMVESRGTRGSSESGACNVNHNPYFKPKTAFPDSTAFGASDYLKAKVTLPLHTGLFQSDRILPVMLLDGLHISITLEDNYRVFRQLDNVLLGRRATLNPIFQSVNGCTTTGSLANGSATTTFHLYQENNMTSTQNCPFVVGEEIGLYNASTGVTASFTGPAYPKIASIAENAGVIQLTTQSVTNNTGATLTTDGQWIVYSNSVKRQSSYNNTYTIENVELVLQQVMMPSAYESSMLSRMREGGSLSYDFLSVTNYRFSQLVSDRVANIRIPIDNSRCKSILCVPTDAEVYSQAQLLTGDQTTATYKVFHNNTRDLFHHSGRSGMVGIADHISNYQFVYDGKLNPSRRVECLLVGNKTSIAQQQIIELDKALSSASINTHSMRKYNENFVIGRALALGSGVYDARNKDFVLQVNYQETNAPSKPKLWKNYVFHLRRLVIKGDSVNVEI